MSLKRDNFSKRADFEEAKRSLKLQLLEVKENSAEGRNFYEKLRKNLQLKYQTGNFGYNCSVKNVTLVDFQSSVELSTRHSR